MIDTHVRFFKYVSSINDRHDNAAQADSERAVVALDAEIAGMQSEYQALLERLSEPD